MTCGCSNTLWLYLYRSSSTIKHFTVRFAIKNLTKKTLWRDMFGMTKTFRENIIHENGWAWFVENKELPQKILETISNNRMTLSFLALTQYFEELDTAMRFGKFWKFWNFIILLTKPPKHRRHSLVRFVIKDFGSISAMKKHMNNVHHTVQ